mgnify:CR=1 FL=1
MAQPPLSNQMKMLEEELGLTLFSRGPHHIELTDAGRLFAARAKELLEMAAATKRELRDFKQGLSGTLALGTVSSSGGILLQEGMRAFRETYPRVQFEIHDGNTYQLIELLEKGLIEEAGRLDLPGRPVSFRTTDTFLRVFGLSSLADLPPVHSDAPADDPTESEG